MTAPTTQSSPEWSHPRTEPTLPQSPEASYEPCVGCGSPLDERQRYCVACGTRRRDANDPAARFLSAATRRRRSPAAAAGSSSVPRRRSATLATGLAVAAIPAALGIGVLIGRSSNSSDANLLAAVRAERSSVVESSATPGATAAGSSSASGSAASVSHPVNTFTLSRGYAVELSTLSGSSTAAAASKVERADRGKGAPGVGVIARSDYQVSPRPSAGAYVIYSGAYSSQAAAQSALSHIRRAFPQAKVISVRSRSASAGASGPVLSKTHFGSAHQVSSYKPSSTSLSQGANVAKQDSHSTGKKASGSGLPDVVAVP